MYEIARLHIPQESGNLIIHLVDSLISSHYVADVSKLRRIHTIFYAVL